MEYIEDAIREKIANEIKYLELTAPKKKAPVKKTAPKKTAPKKTTKKK